MYGDQFGEFVCGYWDLKGSLRASSPFGGDREKG